MTPDTQQPMHTQTLAHFLPHTHPLTLVSDPDRVLADEAAVPHGPTDEGIVLLFHVGLIVLVVRAAAREIHRLLALAQIAPQMVIQEL